MTAQEEKEGMTARKDEQKAGNISHYVGGIRVWEANRDAVSMLLAIFGYRPLLMKHPK